MKTLIMILLPLFCISQTTININGGLTGDSKGMVIGAGLLIPVAEDWKLEVEYKERNASVGDLRNVDLGMSRRLLGNGFNINGNFGGQWDNVTENINPYLGSTVMVGIQDNVSLMVDYQSVFKMSTSNVKLLQNITFGVVIDLVFAKDKPKRFF
jgi:hypothetical protein